MQAGCSVRARWHALAILALALAGCTAEPYPAASPYPSIDDLPECDGDQPSAECLKKLFLPLNDTPWPFDRERVNAAYSPDEFQVVPGWDLTALHVLDGRVSSDGRVPNCYAPEFLYAPPGEVIERPNCGELLVLGGHPRSAACETEGLSLLSCVDEVPLGETFDIGLVKAERREATLEVRDDVKVGEEVFAIGRPGFLLLGLDAESLQSLESGYPLVSAGKVLEVNGRGLVVSNLAYPGNSGGPLVDRDGRVVGVLYSKVRDLRSAGTPTDPQLPGYRTLAVAIGSEMKARIEAEPQ
jgi:hypothetical protein